MFCCVVLVFYLLCVVRVLRRFVVLFLLRFRIISRFRLRRVRRIILVLSVIRLIRLRLRIIIRRIILRMCLIIMIRRVRMSRLLVLVVFVVVCCS